MAFNRINASTAAHALGSALIKTWEFSTQASKTLSNLARETYNDRASTNAIPFINNLATRCTRLIPDLINPYPYQSVAKIHEFLIYEILNHVSFNKDIRKISPEILVNSLGYAQTFDQFCETFAGKTMGWIIQLREDQMKAKGLEQKMLLDLEDALLSISNGDAYSLIKDIITPYYDKIFRLSQSMHAPQTLHLEAEIALGFLLLTPEKRGYQQYLIQIVETSVATLYQSDIAMRYLGDGYALTGRDKLFNKTKDAIDMVSLYAQIVELENDEKIAIPHETRKEKISQARKLLATNQRSCSSTENPILKSTINLLENINAYNRFQKPRSPLTIHIQELAEHLYSDEGILQLPIFTLNVPKKHIGTVNLFERAYTCKGDSNDVNTDSG